MSIATELTRIKNAKTSLKEAINAKGGTLTNELIGSYAAAVTALPAGPDISDTTAVASDVLTGKYFYLSNGTKTQGTISSKSTQTYTPTTANQTISSGQYLSGDQIVLGDGNLLAGNIKKDVTIFGVVGTLETGSSGTDVSDTTAVAGDVLAGKVFHLANGNATSGSIQTVTQSAPVISIASDGTITASHTSTTGYVASSATTTATGSITVDADKIIAGKSIYGTAGTATSDATATADKILSGFTAYVNGVKLTGTGTQGVDVSDTTTTATDVLSGTYFYTSSGTKTEGTITTVVQGAPTVTIGANGVVTASHTSTAGYVASAATTTATASLTIDASKVLAGQSIYGVNGTATSDADAVASDIIIGKTAYVNGIKLTGTGTQGIDVSDTTATASDVLTGKYFYNSSGVKTQGSITTVTQPNPTASVDSSTGTVTASYTPVSGYVSNTTVKTGSLQLTTQSAQTITPTTSDQTISAGTFLTGVQTIKGDINLTAANIAQGVTIFGIAGTHSGGSGVDVSDTTAVASDVLTGKYFYTAAGVRTEGTNTGGGGETTFYKCTSVAATETEVSPSDLTSENDRGYNVTASSVYSDQYRAYIPFSEQYYIERDRGWFSSQNGESYPWLQIQLPTAAVVNSYRLYPAWDSLSQVLTEWVLKGSNDGNTWTDLDTKTGMNVGQNKNWTSGLLSNTTAYSYYRIQLYRGSYEYVGLARFDLSYKDVSGGWTGYKAVWNSAKGNYEYESSLTSDTLTCGSVFPQVGKTYSANALIEAELWEGTYENQNYD